MLKKMSIFSPIVKYLNKTTDFTRNDKENVNSKRFFLTYFLAGLLLSSIMVVIFSFISSSPQHFNLDELKVNFPGQNNRLWRILKSTVKEHHGLSNNKKPAVLFLGHKNQQETINSFSTELASMYSSKCKNNYIILDGVDFEKRGNNLRESIENAISSGACAILIKNFENIEPASLLAFHHFCDHKSAKYNDVFYIFTANLTGLNEVDVNNHYKWHSAVSSFLIKSFKERNPEDMSMDRIKALISRVTDQVGIIVKEDNFK